jgi:hypothetical protein
MIDGIMQGKHMKKIFEIKGIFSIYVLVKQLYERGE